MINDQILSNAILEIGVSEIPGKGSAKRIMEYAREGGFPSSYSDDSIAWCSVFMNYIALKCNAESTGKMTARSWLNVGEKVSQPMPGDVVIFWRGSKNGWQGHVGIFLNFKGGNIQVLGGNQSNQVNVSPYSASRLLGFRRLKTC